MLRRHPNLYRNEVLPHRSKTVSIDGSRVETLGVINVPLRINGRYLRINCRIVRNLVYDLVLGWDFFSKYKCGIHPNEGHVTFENEKIDLMPNTAEISSTHFSLAQDTVVPSLSKVITQATFYVNPSDKVATSDLVHVEPAQGLSTQVAVARSISKVQNGHFPVELLNPFPCSMLVKADTVLGQVSFTSDKLLMGCTLDTDINIEYGAEDSGYESEGAMSCNEAEATPKVVDPGVLKTPPRDRPPPKPTLDYSTIAEDAKPHLDELKALL